MPNYQFQSLISDSAYSVDYDVIAAISKEGLKESDYVEICRRLNRPPNRTELGMFGVMWSEHCCYRNSRPLLKKFPVEGERILVGPGENAGVVDLGENQRLVFKIESHNHPSAVEPFQGAATGVGGILRDIFTMGARPIAVLNALRFGPLEDQKNISLMEGVVAGIAHYGNCVGVPTVGGEVVFDQSYSGNPLVNAMALGLMETDDIVCSGAKGIDYPVIYVGSTTGRDGMGGASFASAELTDSSLDDRPAVQVGDPFLEKGLIEACLEAFKSGDVISAQDMGAAGLTCSCAEMAAKGGLGIELDLDLVPAREENMTPYEFLLSESQERMLFVVKPNCEEELMNRFLKWGLKVAVVGRVLPQNIVRVLHNGKVAAEIPANALAENTPINNHTLIKSPPNEITNHWQWTEHQLPDINSNTIKPITGDFVNQNLTLNDILLKLLDNPTISSKRWIYRQYDHQVQNNTILVPGIADAAVIRLRPQNSQDSKSFLERGVAVSVDCINRWVALDPKRGGIAAVAEAGRNVSCVGAEPLAITNNLNFASPETATGYWQLALACEGISEACRILKTPVTGGNVSLYNETRISKDIMQPIQPTPVIGMVGLLENIQNICSIGWNAVGDSIWLLGTPLDDYSDFSITLAATSYLEVIHGSITGRPPLIDLNFEKYLQSNLRKAIKAGLISSAHDLSDGGLAVALSECCIASGLGAHCEIPLTETRLDRILFGEGGSRVLVTINSKKQKEWNLFLTQINSSSTNPLLATKLGTVKPDENLLITQHQRQLIQLSVSHLNTVFENAIPRRVAKESFSLS